jgi:hypothetical protein
LQQLGRHRQVDLSAREVRVAEIGGKHRQQPLHIGAPAIPVGQPMYREAVPEVMQAQGLARACGAMDSGGATQIVKRCFNGAACERLSIPVCKKE